MSLIPQPSSSRSVPSTLASRGHRRPDSEDPPFSQYRMPSSPPTAQADAVFRTGNASLVALDALQPAPRIKTSRVPSAASSSSSSVPQRIDVKRLLAKPARPVGTSSYPASASAPSVVGTETVSDASSVLTSYTDGSGLAGSRYAPSVSGYSIRSQPAAATSLPLAERPRKASLQTPASPSVPTPTKRRETLSSGVSSTPTRPSGLPSPSSSSLPRRLPRQSSNNNISNSRPSELPKPTIRPASATTAASPGPPRPLKSPYRPVTAAAATTNTTSQSLPASRSPSHTRSRPVITPSNPVVPPLAPPPPDLTPAGAVIHTYKEQERRRSVFENLARPSSSPSSSISQSGSSASAGTGMLPPPRMPAASASSSSLPSPDGSGHSQSETGHSTLPRRHNRVLSFTAPFQNVTSNSENGPRESTAEPYFTVLGAKTGRVVAVGGPADDDWSVTPSERRHVRSITTATVSVGRSASAQAEKGLQRKLSGRLVRKSHTEDEEGRLRGRPGTTLQERRTASTPSAANGRAALSVSTAHMNYPEQVWAGPSEDGQTPRSANMSARTPNDQPSSPGAGTRLWKLMKRLSTGGLKEKAAAMALNAEDAPPVPALPEDLRRKRMTFDVGPRSQPRHVGQNGEEILPPMPSGPAKLVKSKSSAAGMRAVAAARNAEASASASGSVGPRARRGTTTTGGTRSSSPVSSSEGGSGSGIFGQTTSTRSSTSSYGEEIQRPALPVPPGRIIPPSRLPALDVSNAATRSLDGHAGPSQQQPRWRANPMPRVPRPGEEYEECPPPRSAVEPSALAPPPRRSTKHAGGSMMHPSNSVPVHVQPVEPQQNIPILTRSQSHGLPRKEFGLHGDSPTSPSQHSPRPRAPSTGAGISPSRMPRPAVRIPANGTGSTHSSPSAASSSAPTTPASTSRTPRSAATLRPPKDMGMIAPVNFGSGGSKESPVPSPVRFRMLDSNASKSAEKKTEQEKADMWDDLLNRSALAGGTLHLGSGEALLSDGMSTRGSTYSEYMR